MAGRFRRMSLAGQLFAVMGGSLVLTASGALAAAGTGLGLRLVVGLGAGVIVSIGVILAAVRRLVLNPLDHLEEHVGDLVEGRLERMADSAMPSRELQRVKRSFDRMVEHLTGGRERYEEAQRILATRTSTVDRLLDFSQTIQGAGTLEQVFAALAHYLRTELNLAGVTIVANEPSETPPMRVRASWPTNLMCGQASVSDMEAGAGPCLRQG